MSFPSPPGGNAPPGGLQLRDEWFESCERLQQAVRDHCFAQERIIVQLLVHTETPCSSTFLHGAFRVPQSPRQSTFDGSRYTKTMGDLGSPRPSTPGRTGCGTQETMDSVDRSRDVCPEVSGFTGAKTETDGRFKIRGRRTSLGLRSEASQRLQELRDLEAQVGGLDLRSRLERGVLHVIGSWVSLKEPPREGLLARLERSTVWEGFIALLICLNSVFMVYTVDFQMANRETDQPLPRWAQAMELTFTFLFGVELALKLLVHRLHYFCNSQMRWNVFDFALVNLAFFDLLVGVNGNATFLRSLRILRVARALRILKFATQLRCMLQSILGSVMSLFWSFMVLLFIFFLFSIALVQMLAMHRSSEATGVVDANLDELLAEYFGSVASTMLTYHSATSGGDDWIIYHKVLSQTGWINAALFLMCIGFTQIALLNILTGIFVENAIKLAIPDRQALAMQQQRADAALADDLRRFLESLDVDSSGTISWKEFSKVANDPRVSTLLAVMGLDIRDAKMFFDMVVRSTGNPEVEIALLTDALLRMKGDATSFDVQAVAFKMHALSAKVEDLSKRSLPVWPHGLRSTQSSVLMSAAMPVGDLVTEVPPPKDDSTHWSL